MSGPGLPSEGPAPRSRSPFALALATVALACAVAGALAPAEHLRWTYSWPPPRLPEATPDRAWYTPLLLTRHRPDSILARLPCTLPQPLPRATRPVVVLATARNATETGALRVATAGDELVLSVGSGEVARLPLRRDPSSSACAYRLRIENGRWTIDGPDGSKRESTAEMPVVSALFSGLDLRAGRMPSIEVTTAVQGARATIVQNILRVLAVLSALTALVVASSWQPTSAGMRAAVRSVRQAARRVGVADAFVVTVLLGWWVVAPAFFDDGWVIAGQKNYAATGDLTTYYDSFGVATSLQHWLVWLQHWLFDASSAMLVLRIPSLACLLGTWALCRWTLGRIAPGSTAAVWALATSFLTGALAWGMTLRPEPVLALLTTAVFACAVRFRERPTPGPLALAAILLALAVSAHPAGIVALAPLVVAAPAVLAWARERPRAALAIVLAGAALLAVLAFLGSDLLQFRRDVASLRTFGVEIAGWRDELTRYSLLSEDSYGTPLRRLWVALAALAVLSFVLRPRARSRTVLLDLPAASLGVAAVLLIATPAKLPWHFGTLIGVSALALACETARLVEAGRRARGWHIRPVLVVGAAMLAAAWAWFPRRSWGDLDLRTYEWTLGLEDRITLAKLAGIVPALVLVVLVAVELARRPPRRVEAAPWRAVRWTVALVALPLIAFTFAVLVADTAKTRSWTLARQNLETLRGDLDCGLADHVQVPVLASMRPLAEVRRRGAAAPATWLPTAPVRGIPRFALAPRGPSRPVRSPWFRLRAGARTGFFVVGSPSRGETIVVEWGRIEGDRVLQLGEADAGGELASDARPDVLHWRFHADGSLAPAPPDANALRFAVRTSGPAGAGIGLTAPVTYSLETLTDRLESERPVLVLPNLLTYFPCAEPPVVRGIASVPAQIVAFRESMWPLGTGTSPFDRVTDLYALVRLPLDDAPDPPERLAVYAVDRSIEGAAIAPPVARRGG